MHVENHNTVQAISQVSDYEVRTNRVVKSHIEGKSKVIETVYTITVYNVNGQLNTYTNNRVIDYLV